MASLPTSPRSTADLISHSPTTFKVLQLDGSPAIAGRLKDIGIHQGLEMTYLGRLPAGGALLFQFAATVIALREEEARCIHL